VEKQASILVESERPGLISNQLGPPAQYKPDTLPFELINSVAETEVSLSLSIASSSLIRQYWCILDNVIFYGFLCTIEHNLEQ
jgi:hypothetical protein